MCVLSFMHTHNSLSASHTKVHLQSKSGLQVPHTFSRIHGNIWKVHCHCKDITHQKSQSIICFPLLTSAPWGITKVNTHQWAQQWECDKIKPFPSSRFSTSISYTLWMNSCYGYRLWSVTNASGKSGLSGVSISHSWQQHVRKIFIHL